MSGDIKKPHTGLEQVVIVASHCFFEERRVADGSGSVMADGSVVDDVIWFGLVQGHEEEWGEFSEAEIRTLGTMAWEIPYKNLPYSGRRNR